MYKTVVVPGDHDHKELCPLNFVSEWGGGIIWYILWQRSSLGLKL